MTFQKVLDSQYQGISIQVVQPTDTVIIRQIASWYEREWKIPAEKTIQKLAAVTTCKDQFQLVMTFNDQPIASGGVYHHVGLLDKEPRFNIHKNWLALVYTIPEKRHQGLGAILCTYIEQTAKEIGMREIHLFTDSAERLYKRLNWQVIERVQSGERNVAVMQKEL